ncbi:MAG: hypothetical protein JW891_04745 [Candidatus Lokiarchaeota archaeon]|nr:hypothetical protein [Candidatus Lokiarchaeota archaeon]
MGKHLKFKEESSVECFRVPKSKRKNYRECINKIINEKFIKDKEKLKERSD